MITEFYVTASGAVTTRLDLEDDIPLPITYNIMDVREPDTHVSHWSKTLKFPGTKTNNQLFQHIFEIGIDGGFNPNKKADIYALQDTLEVLRGVLQLKKINRAENLDVIYYECNAYGGTDNLFTKIDQGKLTDLNFSAYDHAYTKANQANSWSATPGTGYVYPMIDYKGKNPDLPTWWVEDFFPALYVKEYWDKIFSYAAKSYTSTFLTNNFFKRLIIPFNKEQYQFTDDDIEDREFRAELSTNYDMSFGLAQTTGTVQFTNDSTGTAYDPSNIYNTGTYQWTIPSGQDGYYSIQSQGSLFIRLVEGGGSAITVTGTAQIVAYLQIYVNGVVKAMTGRQLFSLSGSYASGSVISPSIGANPLTVRLDKIFLAAGDTVEIKINADPQYTVNPFSGATTSYLRCATGAYFKNEFQNIVTENVGITMNRCIPADVMMKDFIMSIVDMFRLYMQIDPDNPNNYLIEPRDDWYNSTEIDWSDKLDYKQGLEIIPMAELQGRRYIYRYKDDKDYYNDLYQKKYLLDGKPRTYGDKIIDVDNDFVQNDIVTQPIFSPTPLADDAETHDRIIPRIFSFDPEKGTAKQIGSNIRVLYWAGLIDYTGISWLHYSQLTSSATVRTQYPYAGHLDDPQAPTLDLSFGVPIEVNWKIKRLLYTDNNLYNAYHKRALEEIIDPNAKLISGYFRLKPTDIFQLSFRNLFRFHNDLYRLNKIIDYDLSSERLTKCEFIKSKDPGVYVPTQRIVIGGPSTIGNGGDILPRPPEPPRDNYENWHNTQEHVVVGTNNNVPRSAVGVIIVGDNNVIGGEAANINIVGSGNIVFGGVENVTLIQCNGLEITASDVLYINNCLMSDCPVVTGDAPVVLFNNYTDVGNSDGTTETDLYSYTLPIDRLSNDGESVDFEYVVNVKTSTLGTETRRMRIYFASAVGYDTTALTLSFGGDWTFRGRLIRTGATTARIIVTVNSPSASTVTYSDETDLTGLLFTTTNVLKITGQAGGVGGAANDMVAKMGKGIWYPSA